MSVNGRNGSGVKIFIVINKLLSVYIMILCVNNFLKIFFVIVFGELLNICVMIIFVEIVSINELIWFMILLLIVNCV